jgi:hypothetical protein
MEKPWVDGPKELLIHGLDHLKKDTHFDCRMAMVCIDNSVEIMIKTYLGLPKRITKIEDLGRNKYEELIKSFPSLLDGLEKYASDKLTGIELGDIEWYHRIRNELYHNGNGITVEKSKVEGYAETAKILFKNLFDSEIEIPKIQDYDSLIGNFMRKWLEFETVLRSKIQSIKKEGEELTGRFEPLSIVVQRLSKEQILTQVEVNEIMNLMKYRNIVVHNFSELDNSEISENLQKLENQIKTWKVKK